MGVGVGENERGTKRKGLLKTISDTISHGSLLFFPAKRNISLALAVAIAIKFLWFSDEFPFLSATSAVCTGKAESGSTSLPFQSPNRSTCSEVTFSLESYIPLLWPLRSVWTKGSFSTEKALGKFFLVFITSPSFYIFSGRAGKLELPHNMDREQQPFISTLWLVFCLKYNFSLFCTHLPVSEVSLGHTDFF